MSLFQGRQTAPWLLSVALIALSGIGCSQQPEQPAEFARNGSPEAAEDLVELPDGTTAEMLELARSSLEESKDLAQQKSSTRGDKEREKQRREAFRVATITGARAADRVLADEQANADQLLAARKAKLLLFYVGAKTDRLKFEYRFRDYADQLAEDHPGTEEAIFAAAAGLELECIAKRASKKEVLPKLVRHAQAHPEHGSGVQLFEVFARQLSSRKDTAGAEACYRKGIEVCAGHADVELLTEGLRRLELTKVRRVARRSTQDSEEREIRGRLQYPDGYFVIYAEENVRPPRGGLMYFYHYEYEVLHGVESAVSYVKNLPETYSWKVERRYPETPEGRRQAYEEWKRLLRKKQSSS